MLRTLLTSVDPALALQLATSWQTEGDTVTVVLLDAAAAAARSGHRGAGAVRAAIETGVRVAAESDALARRGLDGSAMAEGVGVVELDDVADLITARAGRAVWL